jgi:L-ascorbate metabolism protein UlaG (beta-lactamase superfamily)
MKFLKRSFMVLLIILLLAAAGVFVFLQQPVFGSLPQGKRLARIQQSPNYRNGAFQNLNETPVQTENFSFAGTLWKFLNPPKSVEPQAPLPSEKTNLHELPAEETSLVWFGHSSYLIKTQGLLILVDPVFSGYAGPVGFMTKSFAGTDVYFPGDFPPIDVMLLTHDHYDHLDHQTILALKDRTKKFVTSLGVGAHLECWGVPADKIVELDWWESYTHTDSVQLTAAPARHFSGRKFTRYQSLWSSFILKTTEHKLYLGGDSGYDRHFKEIGDTFGPFDLALLECGQYNTDWPLIHMMPEQTVQASIDLKANVLMPVHWGKFKLAFHHWTEPIERATAAAEKLKVPLTTPKIGEVLTVGKHYPQERWYAELQPGQ